jgi:DedD protein
MSSDVRSLRSAPDDGFHEIHLSGKQLVFLFMATTLVSIVIFLCGVLVGRGARMEPAMASEFDEPMPAAAPEAAPPAGDPVIDSSAPAAKPEPGQPTQVESGDFNYFQMLTAEQQADEVPQPPAEDAGPAPSVAAEPPAQAAAAPVPVAPAAAAAPAAVAPPPPAPAANAVTIQVTALKERAEAERVAARLVGRGYEAYVAEPAPGTSMYRVRVGHFTDRAEADRVKNRLSREEKFKPWITR